MAEGHVVKLSWVWRLRQFTRANWVLTRNGKKHVTGTWKVIVFSLSLAHFQDNENGDIYSYHRSDHQKGLQLYGVFEIHSKCFLKM